MKKTGNSDVRVCVQNLLQLQRGEVHLDQLRGIRADIVDKPATEAALLLQGSAYTCIECYEPRADFDSLAVAATNREGDFTATANT